MSSRQQPPVSLLSLGPDLCVIAGGRLRPCWRQRRPNEQLRPQTRGARRPPPPKLKPKPILSAPPLVRSLASSASSSSSRRQLHANFGMSPQREKTRSLGRLLLGGQARQSHWAVWRHRPCGASLSFRRRRRRRRRRKPVATKCARGCRKQARRRVCLPATVSVRVAARTPTTVRGIWQPLTPN